MLLYPPRNSGGFKRPARRAGPYPGTCRELSKAQLEERRAQRPPALRLRAEYTSYTVQDDFYGTYTGLVDDFVLVRNDGTYAYNLSSVVDDAFVGVEQIVRGDDLLLRRLASRIWRSFWV